MCNAVSVGMEKVIYKGFDIELWKNRCVISRYCYVSKNENMIEMVCMCINVDPFTRAKELIDSGDFRLMQPNKTKSRMRSGYENG